MEQQQEKGTGVMDRIRHCIDKQGNGSPHPAHAPVVQLLHFNWKSLVLFVLFGLSVLLLPVVLLVL